MSSVAAQILDRQQAPESSTMMVRRFASALTPMRRQKRNAGITALNALQGTLNQLAPFVNLIPVPGLGLLVISLSNVIDAVRQTTGNEQNLIALNQHLRLLLESVLKPLEGKQRIPSDMEDLFAALILSTRAASESAQNLSRRSLVSRIINSADHAAGIAQMTQRVNDALTRFIAGVLVVIGVGNDEGHQDVMCGLKETLEGIEVIKQIMGNIASNQAKSPEDAKDIATSVARLREGISNLDMKQDQMQDAVTSMQSTINDVNTQSGLNAPANELAILNSLPHAQAHHDAYARRAASGCLPGTRVSVLNDVYEWMDSDDTSREILYWLSGLGGIGKSTIAQTVAEREAGFKRLGASFFFSRDVADRRHAKQFFPTLAYQLAFFHQEFRRKITSAIDRNPNVAEASFIVQLQKLIIEPLRLVRSAPHTVTMIVDALDECYPAVDAETLVRLLASEIPRLPFRLQILITSRPEHRLRTVFRSEAVNPIAQHFILHEMDKSVVQQDIERYLRHELALAATTFSITEPWPSDAQVNALVDRAGAFFIFATTATRFITDELWANPKHQLKLLLNGRVLGSSPHATIDLLYHQIISEALPSVDLRARFRRIVGPIVVLFDPLSAAGLEKLLQEEDGTVAATISSLHSVLIVPTEKERHEAIRIMHPSFPDYLTDPERCKNPEFCIKAPESHAVLARKCLRSLLSAVRRDLCGIAATLRFNSEVDDLQARVESNISEEARYACRHFGNHLQHAREFDDDLRSLVSEFLQAKVLGWLEALSLMGSLRDAIPNLRAIENYLLDVAEDTRDLLVLVHDARRFVVMFYEPIQLCAAQVYESAFLFMPNCRLRRTYEPDVSTTFDLLAGRDQSWTACTRVLEGHSSFIYCVKFSPDGTRIASASWDGTVRLYDAATGTVILVLPGQNGPDPQDERLVDVHALAFSLDGRFIATGSDDGVVRVWRASTAVCITSFWAHTSTIHSIAFSCQGVLATSSADRSIRIFDSTTYAPKAVLTGHSEDIYSIAFSPNGIRLASGSADQTVKLWRVEGAEEPAQTLTGHSDDVHSVAFSSDGTRLASSSRDSTIRIWDGASGIHVATFELPIFAYTIAFSPGDNRSIVAGCEDGSVQIWDERDRCQPRCDLGGHDGPVYSVAFSADGVTVASGSTDRLVRLWDSSSHLPATNNPNSHPGSIFSIAKSADGERLVTCASDGTLRLWNFATGELLNVLWGHDARVYSARFSPDPYGRRIASGSADATMILWDSRTGKAITTLPCPSAVYSVAFSPDGTKIGYGTRMNAAYLIDATSDDCHEIAKLDGHEGAVYGVTFSPDSKVFATASKDRTVRLWDAASGDCIFILRDHPDEIFSLEYSADGRYIAAAMEHSVVLWDAITYQRVNNAAAPSDKGSKDALKQETESAPLIGVIRGWVTHLASGTRLLWLPLHLRPYLPECTITHLGKGLSMATGTEAGQVIIFSSKDRGLVAGI